MPVFPRIQATGCRRRVGVRNCAKFILIALVTLWAWPAAAEASDPDLLGQWHLDASEQRSTPDSSGHGHDGDVDGAAVRFVPGGRFGNALDLNGEGGRVDVAGSEALEPERVTAMAWVRSGGSPGPLRYILAKGAEGCEIASYALHSSASGGLSFSVFASGAPVRSPDAGRRPVGRPLARGRGHLRRGRGAVVR